MTFFNRGSTKPRPFFDGVPSGATADAEGKVIVIGAGAAGLSAARVLRAEGREVIVLEGRNRLGGRLSTIEVGEGIVDEGGNWIHGAPANPLYHLALEAGLEIHKDDLLNPLQLVSFDKVSGRRVNSLKITYFLLRVARLISRYGKADVDATHPENNLAERLDKEISRVRGATNRRQFRSLLRTVVDMIAAKESEYLHTNAIALNPDDGGSDYVISGGYSTLIQQLADGLDVRLDTRVESIRYGDEGVVVNTADGSHEGSHAIVTVPLGVLKAHSIAFDPPLPEPKLAAIENIGAGVVEKIVLTFENPFWRSRPEKPQSVFYISDVLGEFPAFVDTTSSAGCPMLVAFLTGDHLDRLSQNPQAFVERAGEVLKEIFPTSYEAPIAVHVTNWGTDPFALCSYSTPTIGVTARDYEQLAEPVAGRVLFAGEATYREHAGFAEGAMGSGIREARRILGQDVDLVL